MYVCVCLSVCVLRNVVLWSLPVRCRHCRSVWWRLAWPVVLMVAARDDAARDGAARDGAARDGGGGGGGGAMGKVGGNHVDLDCVAASAAARLLSKTAGASARPP